MFCGDLSGATVQPVQGGRYVRQATHRLQTPPDGHAARETTDITGQMRAEVEDGRRLITMPLPAPQSLV